MSDTRHPDIEIFQSVAGDSEVQPRLRTTAGGLPLDLDKTV